MSAGGPVISVVMTSYADELPRLKCAIDSVLTQTYKDLELVITFEPGDANADVLTDLCKDERLVVLKNSLRAGKAGSFNHGLAKTRGRYIARMDSDDRAYPDRLEKQLAFLNCHPDIAVIGSGVTIVDEAGHMIATRNFGLDHGAIVRNFALTNAMCHPTTMWDRRMVGEDLRYDPNFSVEDLELWFRLLSHGHRFANLDEPLIEYRQTAEWRRPMQNWRGNLRVRVAYWHLAFRYPYLFIGLVAFAALALMPRSIVDRITERNFLSDFVRSIRPNRTSQPN